MDRRDFTRSAVAGAAAFMSGKTALCDFITAESAVQRLAEHRIASVVSKRSSDRYAITWDAVRRASPQPMVSGELSVSPRQTLAFKAGACPKPNRKTSNR